jgi:hypothetical protein
MVDPEACGPLRRNKESIMKTCPQCGESIPAGFRFCLIDGNYFDRKPADPPLIAICTENANPAGERAIHVFGTYRVTMLAETSLPERLIARLREVSIEAKLTWPEFRRNPLRFGQRLVKAYLAFGRS